MLFFLGGRLCVIFIHKQKCFLFHFLYYLEEIPPILWNNFVSVHGWNLSGRTDWYVLHMLLDMTVLKVIHYCITQLTWLDQWLSLEFHTSHQRAAILQMLVRGYSFEAQQFSEAQKRNCMDCLKDLYGQVFRSVSGSVLFLSNASVRGCCETTDVSLRKRDRRIKFCL